MFPQACHRFLCDILRFAGIAKHPPGDPVNARRMCLYQ
jgi:hypothetical protein